MADYECWRRELNRDDFSYWQFGENFTVEGMTDDTVHIGDVFRVGDVLVERSEHVSDSRRVNVGAKLPYRGHTPTTTLVLGAATQISTHPGFGRSRGSVR